MSVVQSAKSPDSNDAGATTVATAAFASAPTAGNCIVGHVSWLGANSPATELSSITDNASGGSNSYTIVDRWTVNSGDAICMATFVAQNIKTGASGLTVTANFSGSMQFRRIEAVEFSNVATTGQPDAHGHSADNATFSTATDAITSGNVTTTANGCQIYGIGYDEQSSTAPTVGTGYTSIDTEIFGAGDAWRTETCTQSTAGSIAATFTSALGADHIGVGIVALAPSAGGSETGTGGITLGAITVAGIGEREVVASGTININLGAITVAGSGAGAETGTGGITLGPIALSGTGEVTETGAGTISLGAITVAGTGEVAEIGTGSITLGAVTLSGSGGIATGATGDGAITLGPIAVAGSAERAIPGSGGIILGAIQVVGGITVPAFSRPPGGDDLPPRGNPNRGWDRKRAQLKLRKDREIEDSIRAAYRELVANPETRERAMEIVAAPRNDESPAQYAERLATRERLLQLDQMSMETEIALRMLYQQLREAEERDDEVVIEQLLAQVL